jgi:hypothetical protein
MVGVEQAAASRDLLEEVCRPWDQASDRPLNCLPWPPNLLPGGFPFSIDDKVTKFGACILGSGQFLNEGGKTGRLFGAAKRWG